MLAEAPTANSHWKEVIEAREVEILLERTLVA